MDDKKDVKKKVANSTVQENNNETLNTKNSFKRSLWALGNDIRKELLINIFNNISTSENLKNHLNLKDYLFKYHISMLELASFVKQTDKGFKLTEKGLSYLRYYNLVE